MCNSVDSVFFFWTVLTHHGESAPALRLVLVAGFGFKFEALDLGP